MLEVGQVELDAALEAAELETGKIYRFGDDYTFDIGDAASEPFATGNGPRFFRGHSGWWHVHQARCDHIARTALCILLDAEPEEVEVNSAGDGIAAMKVTPRDALLTSLARNHVAVI